MIGKIDKKNGFQTLTLIFLFLVCLFQVTHLDFPMLNGDEALYMLLHEQIQKLIHGFNIDLNPIIHYSGPLDFWILGSVYEMTSWFAIPAGAWMVRIVPFVLFWLAAWSTYTELKKWSKPVGTWFIFTLLCMPIALIYSRFAMPHSVAFPACIYLLGEVFRIKRTSQIRWFRIALVAGIGSEAHTITFVGLVALFLPIFPTLLKVFRRQWVQGICAGLLYLLLAYPVVRNFPPPVGAGQRTTFYLQLRSLINIVSGVQPFDYILNPDPAPPVFHVSLLLFLGFAFWIQIKEIKNSKKELDQMLRFFWISHSLITAYILIEATRGRDLRNLGTERYFLSVTPGWTLLQADALRRVCARYFAGQKKQLAFATVLFLAIFGRFAWSTGLARNETDPNLLTARWLMETCPKETCLAYAENFWNYWPIRYYSRDSIDVNFITYNWKPVPHHSPKGRRVISCWRHDSDEHQLQKPQLAMKASQIKVFPDQKRGPGNTCYLDVSGSP